MKNHTLGKLIALTLIFSYAASATAEEEVPPYRVYFYYMSTAPAESRTEPDFFASLPNAEGAPEFRLSPGGLSPAFSLDGEATELRIEGMPGTADFNIVPTAETGRILILMIAERSGSGDKFKFLPILMQAPDDSGTIMWVNFSGRTLAVRADETTLQLPHTERAEMQTNKDSEILYIAVAEERDGQWFSQINTAVPAVRLNQSPVFLLLPDSPSNERIRLLRLRF
jgi:hypothetical protein